MKILVLLAAIMLSGCVAARVAGAVVDTGVGVAKTGVKAGAAIGDAAVDAVDEDDPQD
jgi:hypothetical protein